MPPPISKDLNTILREFSVVPLNDTAPAAPDGKTNVSWQTDEFGNISANVPTGGGGGGTPGGSTTQLQYNNAGSFGGTSGGKTDGTHFALGAGSVVNPTTFPTPDFLDEKIILNVSEANTSAIGLDGIGAQITNSPTADIDGRQVTCAVMGVNSVNYDGQAVTSGKALALVASARSIGNTRPMELLEGGSTYSQMVGNADITTMIGFTGEVDANGNGNLGDSIALQGINQSHGTGNNPWMAGLNIAIDHAGTGTVDMAVGASIYGSNDSTGTITAYHGYESTYWAGGTTTDFAADFFAYSPNLTNPIAGTITNKYGLYIEEQKPAPDVSSVTNGWQIYSAGTAPSHFAGPVSVTRLDASVLYSAAGTPLPAAAAGLKGSRAVVSDATTPTFLGAYVSGGAVVSPVICNGTAWVTA